MARYLLLLSTFVDFAVILKAANLVFGRASWNFFFPFTINLSVTNFIASSFSSLLVFRI